MTLRERIRIKSIIRSIALREGKHPKEIHEAMQEALDAAWAAAWQPGNIRAQVTWQQLFPGGKKPTVDAFIMQIVDRTQHHPE